MPWKNNDYPPSMKNLEPRVRHKAVEIANALLEEGYEEGRAIAIATAKAKEWDDDHPRNGREDGGRDSEGDKSDGKRRDSGRDESDDKRRAGQSGPSEAKHKDDSTERPKKGTKLHVVPDGEGWAVKEEGEHRARINTDTKAEAVDKAKEWASNANTSAIVHRKDGTVETSHNYS